MTAACGSEGVPAGFTDRRQHGPAGPAPLRREGQLPRPGSVRDASSRNRHEGIRIKAAGIGSDYREETIRTLGTVARGEWTHLDAAGDIESFFGDAVEEAGTVDAPDARLELDVADGVEVSEVYRSLPQTQSVNPDWEDNTAVVPLPDLLDRETQRVVLGIHAHGYASQNAVPA